MGVNPSITKVISCCGPMTYVTQLNFALVLGSGKDPLYASVHAALGRFTFGARSTGNMTSKWARPRAWTRGLALAVATLLFTSCRDDQRGPLNPGGPRMYTVGPDEVDLIAGNDVTINGARWISGLTFKVGT